MTQPLASPAGLSAGITIAELLRTWPQAGPALLRVGLPCMGCAIAPFHTIAEAAKVHGVDEAALRQLLEHVIGA